MTGYYSQRDVISDGLHPKDTNGIGETYFVYESGPITAIPFNRRRNKSLRIDEENPPEIVLLHH